MLEHMSGSTCCAASRAPNRLLRTARETCGWSQEHLAELVGVTARTILRWEQGDTKPSPRFTYQLCRVFEMIECELGLAILSLPETAARRGQRGNDALMQTRVYELERLAEIHKYRAVQAEHHVKVLEAELSRWRNLHPLKTLPESH